MNLKRLIISNFKNIEEADLIFSPGINCICGENGQGKTNLIEAVHYLSMSKSFLSSQDKFAIRHSEEQALLHGDYLLKDGLPQDFSLRIDADGGKLLRRGAKAYERISDHIGTIPIVVVSPSDSALITDGGLQRRRFMDMLLCQTNHEYLSTLQKYNKSLEQRNVMLKQECIDRVVLSLFDNALAECGHFVHKCRAALVEQLLEMTRPIYAELSGGREQISMVYESDLGKGDFAKLLEGSFERDRVLRYTSVGIQKDELHFYMDGFPMRKTASQGQQKTFLVSLKMAQYRLMKDLWGYAPILLLDDVFDKLDAGRVEALVRRVCSEDFGQIFITDHSRPRLEKVVNSITDESSFFDVKEGKIKAV
ncbi:MAG: DNA replication/repair protein RecF [Bacteroidales bacterium]|nr:DNA replication/repair protein RecF [Bacteroidales bacterium]